MRTEVHLNNATIWWMGFLLWAGGLGVWAVLYVWLNRRAASALRDRLRPLWSTVFRSLGLREQPPSRTAEALLWSGEVKGRSIRISTYQRVLTRFLSSWKPTVRLVLALPDARCRLAPSAPKMPVAQFADASSDVAPGIVTIGWQASRASGRIPVRGAKQLIAGVLYDGLPPALNTDVRHALERWVVSGRAYITDDALSMVFRAHTNSESAAKARDELNTVLDDAILLADWAEGRL